MQRPEQENNLTLGIKGHFVICNWSKKGDEIVKQLHDKTLEEKSPIVIVTEKPFVMPQSDEYFGVLLIPGDPANYDVLRRADISNARSVLILADDEEPIKADSKSILIALAVDNIAPNVHTVVEIINSKNKLYFKYTNADEIVCMDEISERLLAQSTMSPGVSMVFMDLLSQSDTSEIYQVDVPKSYVGKSFGEFKKDFDSKKLDWILIGFITKEEKVHNGSSEKIINGKGNVRMQTKVFINPRGDVYDKQFAKGDQVIIIDYNRPNLENLFNK
jgi:Trk K+ transport system NAD-binding subunit